MDVKNYINSAIDTLKSKAVVAQKRVSKVLSPINEIPQRINSAIDFLKSTVGTKIKTEKLQMQKMLSERQQEWDIARVNLDFKNKIYNINSKLPMGLSIPTNFKELDDRLMQGFGGEDFQRVNQKIATSGYKSLTPDEQKVLTDASLGFAGMTSGVNAKGFSKVKFGDPMELTRLKNSISEGESYLKAGKDALGKVLTPEKRVAIEKAVASTKDKILKTLQTMKGKETQLKGLLTESPAQTKARRLAQIKPKEVYQGTIDKIRQNDLNDYVLDNFDGYMKAEPLTNAQKVNIFDYLKTPSTVLEKIGLKSEADNIAKAWDNYQLQLPKEVGRIRAWMDRVPEKGSEVRIFDYLDGKAKVDSLLPEEQKVATEIRGYLDFWAKKLGLTEGNGKISNYITHIFPKGSIAQEFDMDIARAVSDKVPSSIWNPFKQKRTNAEGYIRDVFQAVQAYTKRAIRQAFVEPHLKALATVSEGLDETSYKFVQKVGAQINMRPTELDSLVDNFLKTIFGYRFTGRPVTYLTKAIRNAVYKGTLGLNISSAVRNTSQLNNSYALLGEKYFLKGGVEFAKRLVQKDLDELYKTGVLNNSFIEDKNLSVFKQGLQKVDDGLWAMFNFAEKLNRGVSYFGAKGKALAEGRTTEEAIKIARNFVSKTQFKFGPLDTPLILGSDTAKLFGQFQSFNLKQGEFLVDLIKSKNFPAIARYIGGNLAFIYIIGKTFGMDWQEMIPFSGVATGETKLGQTPAISGISGVGNMIAGSVFGNEEQFDKGKKDALNSLVSFIPGGVQAKKTISGIKAGLEGGVYNPNGKLRFPAELNLQNTLFGPNVSETAQEYYKKPSPLSENQTATYKALISAGMTPQQAYDSMTAQRESTKKLNEVLSEEDKSFDLFGFLKGKKETPESVEKSGLFGYLQKETQQTEQNKILSEIFSKVNTPEEAQKAIDAMGLGITYQEAMIQMVKSLTIENRSEYLFEEIAKQTNEEFGKSLQAFVENKVITSSVIDNWEDTGKITEARAKTLKNYIKMRTGKKFSAPKVKRFKINGKIKKAKKGSLKLAKINFKPLKIKIPA